MGLYIVLEMGLYIVLEMGLYIVLEMGLYIVLEMGLYIVLEMGLYSMQIKNRNSKLLLFYCNFLEIQYFQDLKYISF